MKPKEKSKAEIKAPDMNPQYPREDACRDIMTWVKKYRLNPRQRGQDFRFDRFVFYDGKNVRVPHLYLADIYGTLKNIRNLQLVIQKARQSRISEFLINTTFYLCDTIQGFTILYILSDDQIGRRFLLKRIDEPINDSDYLSFMVSSLGGEASQYRTRRKGSVDSLDIKKMGKSWFYMLASRSKSASRSPDADMVVFDEYDIHDMDKEESFLSTTDDSEYITKFYVSTPTEPKFGIELRYIATSMGQWKINCPACFTDFEMNSEYFFNGGIKVLDVERESDGAKRIYVCPNCGREITPMMKQVHGRWVHKQPALIRYNRIGFQFSNLILPHITADKAWQDYRDFVVKPGGEKKFFNEKLGESKSDEEKALRFSREVMLKCCVNATWVDAANNTVMGVDWGKDTHVVIWTIAGKKIRLLNFFTFPHDPKPLANAEKVMKLIPRFNPRLVVADFGAGQEQNKYLYERIQDIFYMAVNNPHLKDMFANWDKKISRVFYDLITVYTTYARWYPAEMIELPEHDEKLEIFIQHHTNSCLITPNEYKAPEGKLVLVGKDEYQEVGHTGPIHLLSAAIFGWLRFMGEATSSIHFSDPPTHDKSEEKVDKTPSAIQDMIKQAHDGRRMWRP